MDATGDGQHHKRMKALVAFSASSFDTEFPSPFGSAIYDERSGVLVAQAYDTVMKMCDRVGAGFERAQRGDGLGGEAYPAVDRARHHSRRDVETETMQVVAGDEERSV